MSEAKPTKFKINVKFSPPGVTKVAWYFKVMCVGSVPLDFVSNDEVEVNSRVVQKLIQIAMKMGMFRTRVLSHLADVIWGMDSVDLSEDLCQRIY